LLQSALTRLGTELSSFPDDPPLAMTDLLYEDEYCLLAVTSTRCLCVSDEGCTLLDFQLSDIKGAWVIDEATPGGVDEVNGLEIDRGGPETVLFDIGDLEWSHYILGFLWPEEREGQLDSGVGHTAYAPDELPSAGNGGEPPGGDKPPDQAADLAGQLERLATLHRQGLLSTEEFHMAKRRLLL